MQMMNLTKSQLVDLVCQKDKELTEVSLNSFELKEQQSILLWSLFIIAGIGFSF